MQVQIRLLPGQASLRDEDIRNTGRLFDLWEGDTGETFTSRYWLWTIEEHYRGRRGPVFGFESVR